jgi:hypothetical protein
MIREGKVLLKVEVPKVVSSEMPVFYNPAMVVNRDISLLIVWAMEGEELVVCDPMGASGVRSLRFLLEVPKVKKVIYNDIDQRAVESFKDHLRFNQVPEEKVEIYSEDASLLFEKAKKLPLCGYRPLWLTHSFFGFCGISCQEGWRSVCYRNGYCGALGHLPQHVPKEILLASPCWSVSFTMKWV